MAEKDELSLREVRKEIDETDREIAELIAFRFHCAFRAARIKRRCHLPLFDPNRELQVLRNVARAIDGKSLPQAAIRRIFRGIMEETRTAEHNRYRKPNLKPRERTR